MLKHHKLLSLCIGLGFLIVLQTFAQPKPVFRFLVPAFLVFAALVTWYNNRYLKEINKYNLWLNLRPLFLLCSAFGVFLVIPSVGIRGLFLILCVALITFFEIILGNSAENLLLNETLIIAFGLFFAAFGAYFYSPGLEPIFLLLIFAGSSLLARSFYEFVPQPAHVKTFGALTLGLFCAELYWVLNFLQFHFSALAVLAFGIFYFCLIINYYYLYHLLNFKKLQFHLFLIAVCFLAVLISTPWVIIR